MNTQCFLMLGKDFKTHVDGTFYQKPEEFPVVLLDRVGCVCLDEKKYDFLVKMRTIRESTGGKVHKINIIKTIQNIGGYQFCVQGVGRCPKFRGRVKH